MFDALVVFVLLCLLDIVTTKRALEIGGVEANPIVRRIIRRLGLPGLFILKYAVFLVVVAYAVLVNSEIAIWAANVLNAAIVAWNSAVLAKMSWRRRK